MKTIVHLISDEKFIDNMIANFEAYSGCNNVYIQINRKQESFKMVKSPLAMMLSIKEFERVYLDKKGSCDMIILHSLHSYLITKIWKVPQRIKILWLPWGFDLYQTPFRPLIKINNLYGHHTSELMKEINSECKTPLYCKAYNWIIDLRWYVYCKLATMRINYFSGVSEYEYDLMNKSIFFKAKKIVFNYNIDFSYKTNFTTSKNSHLKGWVWVGNSATQTNNHIEVLNFLKTQTLNIKRITVPLSYGDEFYGKHIINIGVEMFGSDVFIPITDFMPLQEYFEQMQQCSIAIFGTMRQQSMGNISIALYLGVKVFLFKDSLLFPHFKQKGFIVFSIEEDLSREMGRGAISYEVAQHNRELIRVMLSPQTAKKNIENLVYTI